MLVFPEAFHYSSIMRILSSKSISAALGAILIFGFEAYGQKVQPSFKGDSSDDVVTETEEVVSDLEVLPGDVEADDAVVLEIEAEHRKELKLSATEVRARFKHGISATLGSAVPWQAYTIEAGAFYSPELFLSFYAGSGRYEVEGEINDQKAYDVEFRSNSFGVVGRYFFDKLSPLSVRGMFGYVNWDGSISPKGSDSETEPTEGNSLSTTFMASGMVVGLGLTVGGVWENGVYVDWTPVGMRRSRITSKDVTNESSDINRVMSNNIEDAGLFGFSNISVGYYF